MKTPKIEKSKSIINPSIVASEKKNSKNFFNILSTPSLLRQENPYFQQSYSSVKKSLFFNRIPDIIDNNNDTITNNSHNNLLKFFLKNSNDYKPNEFKSNSFNLNNNSNDLKINGNGNNNNSQNNNSEGSNSNNNNSNNEKNDSNDDNNNNDNEKNDNSMEIEDTFINNNNNNSTTNINVDEFSGIKSDEITILDDIDNNENLEVKFTDLLKQVSSLDTINKDEAFESLVEIVSNCNLDNIIQYQGYILECIKFGFIEDNYQIILQSLSCLEKIIQCKKQLQEKKESILSENNETTTINGKIIIDNSIMSRLALILSDFKNNNTIINKTLQLMECIFKDNPLEEYISILLDKALEYDIKIKKILIEFVEKLILYTYSKTNNSQELNIDKDNKLILNDDKENGMKDKVNSYLLILIRKINEADAKQRINLLLSFISILKIYPLKENLMRFLQIYINFSKEITLRRRLQHFAVILCRDNSIGNNSKNNSISSDKTPENDIIKIPNCIILFEAINSLPPSQRKQIRIILNKDIPNFDEVERNQKQLKVKLNALKQKKPSDSSILLSSRIDENKPLVQEPKSMIELGKPETSGQKSVPNSHANKRLKTSLTTLKVTHATRFENNNVKRKKPSIKTTLETETKVSLQKVEDKNCKSEIVSNKNTTTTSANNNNNSNNINNNNVSKNNTLKNHVKPVNTSNRNIINKNIKITNQNNNDKSNNPEYHNSLNSKPPKNDNLANKKQATSKIPEYSLKNSSTIKKQIPRPASALLVKSKQESNHMVSKIPISSKDHHYNKPSQIPNEHNSNNDNHYNKAESK